MTLMHRPVWLPGGESTDTPGTAEQLNAASIWKAHDRAALAGIDDSDFAVYANDACLLFFVPSWGLYSWQSTQSRTHDGEIVINGPNGQYWLECPHGDAIFAYLEPRLSEIEDRLEALE